MSNLLTTIEKVILAMLPVLKSAAQKAADKLPAEQKQQVIAISKMIEVIKQLKGNPKAEILAAIKKECGLSEATVTQYLINYYAQNGVKISTIDEAFGNIGASVEAKAEIGLKSFWQGMMNTISAEVANIDWQALALGLGEIIWDSFVKGKINLQ